MNKKEITEYYDYTLPFYKNFWYRRGGSYGIHYGMWNEDTNSLKDALVNTNRTLASKVNINEGDKVLDAGCGVGGSAIWLAKEYDVQVAGITISEEQIQEAERLSRKEEVENKTEFKLEDFTSTDFDNDEFDLVWAIESVCHAEDKLDFLKEAYRVLREGGRILISDGFLMHSPQSEREKQILKDFCSGFSLPNLENYDNFKKLISKAGFENVRNWNKTKEILPTSRRMYAMGLLGYPISKIIEKLRLTSSILTGNNLALIRQHQGFKGGLMGYGFFYGEKN